ncbi:MAG: hypothetical protein ACI4EW_02050 [Butyrivibrio sp.]
MKEHFRLVDAHNGSKAAKYAAKEPMASKIFQTELFSPYYLHDKIHTRKKAEQLHLKEHFRLVDAHNGSKAAKYAAKEPMASKIFQTETFSLYSYRNVIL